MVAWYLNKALTNFRNEVNQLWPNRDKRSDGTIGDAAHQATNSDHNPDPDGSVDAWDIDVDGIDIQLVLAAAIRHEATHYVIYNRRITSRTMTGGLGTWHAYYGPSAHTEHIHVSTRDAYENSTKPWIAPLIAKDDDVSAKDVVDYPLTDPTDGSTHRLGDYVRYIEFNVRQQITELVLPKLAEIEAKLDGLAK